MMACTHNNKDLAERLIKSGAIVNDKNNVSENANIEVLVLPYQNLIFQNDTSPLHYSCSLGNNSLVLLLVENGADVNGMDKVCFYAYSIKELAFL